MYNAGEAGGAARSRFVQLTNISRKPECHKNKHTFSFDKYRIPKHNTNHTFQNMSFEKEVPSWGFQAGCISQLDPRCPNESCYYH